VAQERLVNDESKKKLDDLRKKHESEVKTLRDELSNARDKLEEKVKEVQSRAWMTIFNCNLYNTQTITCPEFALYLIHKYCRWPVQKRPWPRNT
jgi:dynactin complex subunit